MEHNIKQALANGPYANSSNNGTPVATSGITTEEFGDGVEHFTIITLTAVTIPITDAGGASGTGTLSANGGYGSVKIYTLPQALANLLLAMTTFSDIHRVGTGIAAGAAVKHSIGTVASSANDTLGSTLANVLPSTSLTLVAGVVSTGVGVNTGTLIVNGTTTAQDLYINFGIADADIAGSDSIVVTGKIKLTWLYGGIK